MKLMLDYHTGIPEQNWDKHLIALNGQFLQSRDWASFQVALGYKVVYQASRDWCWLGVVKKAKGITQLYLPYGPTIKDNFETALTSIIEVAERLKVDFIRFEPIGIIPEAILTQYGAKKVADIQPQHTLILDLTKSEEELRGRVSSSYRNLINTAGSRGLTFNIADRKEDLVTFLTMMHKTAKGSKFKAFPDKYYRILINTLGPTNAARLYLAKANGQTIAGAIGFEFNSIRYYAHAASFQDLNRQFKAAGPLLWWMVMDAKRQNYKYFDFWGVTPDDDPDHPWHGLSQFKRLFGGVLLSRLGTWEIPVKKSKYRLYTLVKKVLHK